MIRFVLLAAILSASCKREQRSFEASAAAKAPVSLAPQGDVAAGGAPLVAGSELVLALPDYAETAQHVSEGKMLYQRMNCVGCHHYGGGGMGPPFMRQVWTYGKAPLDIATSIIAGRTNGMPSYRGKLTGTELGELVAYVRVLGDLVRTDAIPARDEHLRLSPDPVLDDLAIPHREQAVSRPAMSVLDPAGPQAGSIASLWWVFEWMAIIVYITVVTVFIIATIRAHRRHRSEGDGDPLDRDLGHEHRMTRVIMVAGATTVLILFVLLVASIRTGAKLASLEDRPDALAVRITAHQWWWQIEYSVDDPRKYVSTANELHLPIGRPVHVELTSADVIHSFWVPSVHGKKDLIPGRINKTWIEVDEPGVFQGQCAEFCGLEHARMRLDVVAESPEAFEKWRHHEQELSRAPTTEVEHRGQQVFLGATCGTCHEIAGTSAGGRLGPELTHLASRTTIGAGAVLNNRGNLGGWLLDPQGVKPGVHMPATTLNADDFTALLAYLESLQ